MNKCLLSIFATFSIMFTDKLTNNNSISMKTNLPHSHKTLAKNSSACVRLETANMHASGSPQNQHAAGMFILWTVGGAAGGLRKCYFSSWFEVSSASHPPLDRSHTLFRTWPPFDLRSPSWVCPVNDIEMHSWNGIWLIPTCQNLGKDIRRILMVLLVLLFEDLPGDSWM